MLNVNCWVDNYKQYAIYKKEYSNDATATPNIIPIIGRTNKESILTSPASIFIYSFSLYQINEGHGLKSAYCVHYLTFMIFMPYFGGILPKGPYLPCLRMADRALLAGRIPLICTEECRLCAIKYKCYYNKQHAVDINLPQITPSVPDSHPNSQ